MGRSLFILNVPPYEDEIALRLLAEHKSKEV
jgi:hypothetical protein